MKVTATLLLAATVVSVATAQTNQVVYHPVVKDTDVFKVHLPVVISEPKYQPIETNWFVKIPTNASVLVDDMTRSGCLTNVVKLLVESGKVCEVIEHKWKYYPNYLDQQTLKLLCNVRVCEVCGKIQSKKEVWE